MRGFIYNTQRRARRSADAVQKRVQKRRSSAEAGAEAQKHRSAGAEAQKHFFSSSAQKHFVPGRQCSYF